MPNKAGQYDQIIERVFFAHYTPGMTEVGFDREEIATVATELGLARPKNLGDVLYTYRHRRLLPQTVRDTAGERHWVIMNAQDDDYRFVLRDEVHILPRAELTVTRIPDSTPGPIKLYALSDEQSLLALLRYNRLLDIFTGIACYSLQSHLKTTVGGRGVETDEVYVGISREGTHYVLPVQAKGGRDHLGIVQIEQDFALCAEKFPGLVARPIAAQFMADDVIALFDFALEPDRGVTVLSERHYQLVPHDQLTTEELARYRATPV